MGQISQNINRTANDVKQQVQIQCELEEAGFDIPLLKQINNNVSSEPSILPKIGLMSMQTVCIVNFHA